MEAYLDSGHIKLEQDFTDLDDRMSLSERPVALAQRESYLVRDANRDECNVFRNIGGMESCIKVEDDTDLDEKWPVTGGPQEYSEQEDSYWNAGNVCGRKIDLESHMKIEENDTDLDEKDLVKERCSRDSEQEDAKKNSGYVFGSFESQVKSNQENICNFDGNQSVTNRLSRQNYQCDVQVMPLERRQSGPHKFCNIKQEEFDDDDNGIIGGFIDDSDNEDMLLDTKHDKEELKQKTIEAYHMHVSRF